MRLAAPVLPRLGVIFSLLLVSSFLFAQGSYRAQLRGVVTDAAGAVISKAEVTITESATNISTHTRTDEKGEYFFTGLRPSTYSVKAEAPGFRATEHTNVVLAVDQESSLNFRMQLAGISTTVDVTTTATSRSTGCTKRKRREFPRFPASTLRYPLVSPCHPCYNRPTESIGCRRSICPQAAKPRRGPTFTINAAPTPRLRIRSTVILLRL